MKPPWGLLLRDRLTIPTHGCQDLGVSIFRVLLRLLSQSKCSGYAKAGEQNAFLYGPLDYSNFFLTVSTSCEKHNHTNGFVRATSDLTALSAWYGSLSRVAAASQHAHLVFRNPFLASRNQNGARKRVLIILQMFFLEAELSLKRLGWCMVVTGLWKGTTESLGLVLAKTESSESVPYMKSDETSMNKKEQLMIEVEIIFRRLAAAFRKSGLRDTRKDLKKDLP